MNIDEMQLIIDAAAAAGEGAFWIVMIWFAKDVFLALIGYAFGAGALLAVYRVVRSIIQKSSFESDVMAELGISVYMTAEEKAQAIRWMRKGKDSKP